ncbi:MAG: site-specific DNA-methyltransferase [Candidatus Accumulibacter sp.]|uniref:site-specific DNA-methyltransferase n=1 Tax=Accumulibacter sp. TaxID=2053492 RepID=UPI00258A8F89|nr:site-specific DNA-methyltransferase [Accumulibacter sp.]MCM8621616.1 site-specific DNA-methyltransferase [Accumulibacter sp.]
MADNYEDYSRDQLIRLLRERDRRPRFGLVWERDEIDHDLSVNSDFVALDWDADLSCGDGPQQNLIIEGDNFDALRYLRMTHAGRVKCIYIDPPYNTGNRDFIYNDRFIDKDDAYRHSKWLEFMYRRLELAKELLTEDGVIFVSIDDNEVFHLGLLMEQLFGAANFVATCIWQKRYSRESTSAIGDVHEYLLVYAISPVMFKEARNRLSLDEKSKKAYSNPNNDRRGPWQSISFTGAGYRPNQMYQIVAPNGNIHLPPEGRHWAMVENEYRKLEAAKRIWWGKDGNGVPRVIRYLSEVDGLVPWTWWPHEEVGHTDEARKEIQGIFGTQTAFDTPKPVRLIERILRIATQPGDIVLDFFAGSGTTAQAVLNLNREDGGERRFILVSSTEATADTPDKNLCRDVCAERVRRVIAGYSNKKGQAIEGLGGGFAYLRCRRIPSARVFRNIQHDQVWTALQLIHEVALTPYQVELPIQTAASSRGEVIYLPKLDDAVLAAVQESIHAAGQAVVYSWQPALLAQRLTDPRVAFEPIPAFLVNRFGARSSSATGGRP